MDSIVKEFLEARNAINFRPQLLRKAPNDGTPILVCIEKNSAWRLPCFLEHYRKLGIKRFVFIDNNSTDDSTKFLTEQPDVDLYFFNEPYRSIARQVVLQEMVELYGDRRWYLIVDADELLVYDGMAQHSLPELANLAEQANISRVRSVLIDMYADCTFEMYDKLDNCTDLINKCCYFNANSKIYKHKIGRFVSFWGGIRQEIKNEMGSSKRKNELTKTPLFYFTRGDLLVNSHFATPYWKNFKSEPVICLLHYKFSKQDFIDLENLNNKDIRRETAFMFLEWLKVNSEKNLMNEHTKKYSSPYDMISNGLMSGINWNNPQQSGIGLNFSTLSIFFGKQKRRRAWKHFSWKIRESLF